MNEVNNNKQRNLFFIGLVTLLLLVVGATYAYFAVTTVNNFGTSIINAEAGGIGSVTLNGSNAVLSMDITALDMVKGSNNVTYYASSNGKTTTPTTVTLGTATVTPNTDENLYHCTYTLSVTHTGTNDMYTVFSSAANKSAGQIILTINGVDYDFYDGWPANNQLAGEFYIRANEEIDITAGLRLINKTNINQSYLADSDIQITISIVNNTFTCAAEKDFTLVNLPTIDGYFGPNFLNGQPIDYFYSEIMTRFEINMTNSSRSYGVNYGDNYTAVSGGRKYYTDSEVGNLMDGIYMILDDNISASSLNTSNGENRVTFTMPLRYQMEGHGAYTSRIPTAIGETYNGSSANVYTNYGYLDLLLEGSQYGVKILDSITITDDYNYLSGLYSIKLDEYDRTMELALFEETKNSSGAMYSIMPADSAPASDPNTDMMLMTYYNQLEIVISNTSRSVTYDFTSLGGAQLLASPFLSEFALALPCGALYGGFTITLEFQDGTTYSKHIAGNRNNAISPGGITHLSSMSIDSFTNS